MPEIYLGRTPCNSPEAIGSPKVAGVAEARKSSILIGSQSFLPMGGLSYLDG